MKLFIQILCCLTFLTQQSNADSILDEITNNPSPTSITDEEWKTRVDKDFAVINDHALLINYLLKKYGEKTLSENDFLKVVKSTEVISKMYNTYSRNIPEDKNLAKEVDVLHNALIHASNMSIDFQKPGEQMPKRKFSNPKGAAIQIDSFKKDLKEYVRLYGKPENYVHRTYYK